MHAEAIGDQHSADHQQKAQRQHHDGRVPGDEIGERIGGQHHRAHGDQHGNDHDRKIIGHAHGGQDRIEREDHVEQDDLHDRAAEGQRRHALLVQHIVAACGIDIMMDFLGRLPDQEQPARDQDQVAPGKFGFKGRRAILIGRADDPQVEHGRGQADDPGDHRQQHQPHPQRQANADPARLLPLMFGQFVRQDRNEHQIVDAQHHFHHHQRDECSQGGGIGKGGKQAVHHDPSVRSFGTPAQRQEGPLVPTDTLCHMGALPSVKARSKRLDWTRPVA